jgi:CelD/BcsL family acetyltransferase involved in cellulose biosynthesis
MESQVIATYDEFLKLKDSWRELHRQTQGSIFQMHEWLALWWKAYGLSRTLHVHTFWNDGLLVGVIPGFKEGSQFGPISLRRFSLLGEEEVYGEYHPLVERGLTEEVAQRAASLCVHELKLGVVDLLDFHGFPPDSEFMMAFISRLRMGAYVRYVRENLPHTLVEGATTGEMYLKNMSGKRRQTLMRHERLLKKEGAEIEIVREWDDGKPFDDLVRLHTARWVGDGQSGRFSSPRFTAFVRDVTERLMQKGNARIYFVRRGSERIAALLTFDVHHQNCHYVVGRDPGHELMRYSVGEVLAMRAMANAFDEGSLYCDLMGGDFHHKHYRGMTKAWYSRATVIPAGVRGVKGSIYWAALAMRDLPERVKRRLVHPEFDNRREPL